MAMTDMGKDTQRINQDKRAREDYRGLKKQVCNGTLLFLGILFVRMHVRVKIFSA
jgi:hypothetical protein